jgi:hypothetical protein
LSVPAAAANLVPQTRLTFTVDTCRNTHLGQTITNQVARNKRWATGCWAGTTSRAVTITLRVAKFPLRQNDGSPGVSARVWFQQMRRILPTPYTSSGGQTVGVRRQRRHRNARRLRLHVRQVLALDKRSLATAFVTVSAASYGPFRLRREALSQLAA